MTFTRTLTFAGLGASTLAALVLTSQGCSSSSSPVTTTEDSGTHSSSSGSGSSASKSSTSATTSASGTSTSAANNSAGEAPPPPDAGVTTMPTTVHNFAMHHLYVGDSDPTPSYTADPNAWKSIGYNIDGLDTTSASATNVCTPYNKNQTVVDGNNGIDNAFGEVIVDMLLSSVVSNLSETVSEKIISGSFTIEIDTTGLTGGAQTATGLGGQLFAGSAYPGGVAPPLTGNYFSIADDWPVSAALLNAPATAVSDGSKVKFPASYAIAAGTNTTWVSGTPVNLALSLSLEGESLTLTIHNAVVSFNYSVANGQGLATNGIISGVLETTEFVSAINTLGGSIEGGALCSVLSEILPEIYEAQDLIINPTTGAVSNTPGTPCNGISIGLAFDADEIAPPDTVVPVADAGAAMPCPGSGSGS